MKKKLYKVRVLDPHFKESVFFIRGYYNARSFCEDVRVLTGSLAILEHYEFDVSEVKK